MGVNLHKMRDMLLLHVFEAIAGSGDALFKVAHITIDPFDPGGDLAELAVFHLLDGSDFFVLLEANFFDALLVREEAFGRGTLDLLRFLEQFGYAIGDNDELFGDFVDDFIDL